MISWSSSSDLACVCVRKRSPRSQGAGSAAARTSTPERCPPGQMSPVSNNMRCKQDYNIQTSPTRKGYRNYAYNNTTAPRRQQCHFRPNPLHFANQSTLSGFVQHIPADDTAYGVVVALELESRVPPKRGELVVLVSSLERAGATRQ